MMQELERMQHIIEDRAQRELFFLQHERPVLTHETRYVPLYSCLNLDTTTVLYETDKQTLQQQYNTRENYLIKQQSHSSVHSAEDYQVASSRLTTFQEYGVQREEQLLPAYILETPYGENGRTTKYFLQPTAVMKALDKAYKNLTNREFQRALRLGYTHASDVPHDEVVSQVMQYHDMDDIVRFVTEYYDETESMLQYVKHHITRVTLQQMDRQQIDSPGQFKVITYYHTYLKRLQTRYLLQPFAALPEEHKELPLSWTLSAHFDMDHLKRFFHTALYSTLDDSIHEILEEA